MTTVHASPTTASTDLSVWPAPTTERPLHGDLAVGGVSLAEIADRFGTPVHVLDEAEIRDRCRTYRDAFPYAEVLYAAKAFLCRAMAPRIDEEGLGLDVCSAGELELAVSTGFLPERITMHGNAKSPRDLATALRLGVGRIVIDSPSEIARLAAAVGYNVIEAIVALTAGTLASSTALIGFGLDSVIEEGRDAWQGKGRCAPPIAAGPALGGEPDACGCRTGCDCRDHGMSTK